MPCRHMLVVPATPLVSSPRRVPTKIADAIYHDGARVPGDFRGDPHSGDQVLPLLSVITGSRLSLARPGRHAEIFGGSSLHCVGGAETVEQRGAIEKLLVQRHVFGNAAQLFQMLAPYHRIFLLQPALVL